MENLKQSRLYKTLCDFKGANGNIDNLPAEFEKIAKAAFYTGYFIINKGEEFEYKIRITDIEFYYHEDDGIQDPRKLLRGKECFFYEVGSLCPHRYGVDILFDDVEDHSYHASFLIREFEVCENGKTEIEKHPQYIWEYLFGGANMLRDGKFAIEWHDENSDSEDYQTLPIQPTKKREFSRKAEQVGDDRLWRYSATKINRK